MDTDSSPQGPNHALDDQSISSTGEKKAVTSVEKNTDADKRDSGLETTSKRPSMRTLFQTDAQPSSRIMMSGRIFSDSDELPASDDSLALHESYDNITVDNIIDIESPRKQPQDEGPTEAENSPTEQSTIPSCKIDPPPSSDDDSRDEELGKSGHTVKARNVGPRGSGEGMSRSNTLVREKSGIDSDSVTAKSERQTCIIWMLIVLVVLSYGGGVYTGVMISSGRDSSMLQLTPAPRPA